MAVTGHLGSTEMYYKVIHSPNISPCFFLTILKGLSYETITFQDRIAFAVISSKIFYKFPVWQTNSQVEEVGILCEKGSTMESIYNL